MRLLWNMPPEMVLWGHFLGARSLDSTRTCLWAFWAVLALGVWPVEITSYTDSW